MPLPLPNLDDRRWGDLVEDARAQLPRYAPQWTDHNLHDPGITLIELFAWLAEMTDYRLNRVTSRHKRKFLALLGFDLAGPTPASATLSFSPPAAAVPFVLPAGTEFEGTNPDHEVIPFRTLRDVTVSAATLGAVLVDDGSGAILDRTHDFTDGFPIDALGPDPRPGGALYLGLDTTPTGVPIAIALRFAGRGHDAAERKRIVDEAAAQAESCQPSRTRLRCAPDPPAVPTPGVPPHHSARMIWEAFTTGGWTDVTVDDDTRSLTLDGLVELTLPTTAATSALGGVATALNYVRCRMVTGAFDAAPVLLDIAVNAAPVEQAVPSTGILPIKAGVVATGAPPAPGDSVQVTMTVDEHAVIQSLTFAAAAMPAMRVWSYTPAGATVGQITLDMELAGIGAGLPDHRVTLRSAPIQAVSLELYTLTGAAWQQWSARDDFDASTRTDFHFVCDSTAGVVTFGSGERGQAPPAGSLIFARYSTTAAEAGNLPARLVNRLRTSPVNDVRLAALTQATRHQLSSITVNRAPAMNGAAAETLTRGLGRAVEVLHAHERLLDLAADMQRTTLDQVDRVRVGELVPPANAVNVIDIERIALSVPGTRVDRARAWSSLHAAFPCLDAPGVVTVVIVPELPLGMPTPSPGLIEAVWRYLNRRRTICTRLQVTGPQYVEVTVTASVHVRPGASPLKVRDRIRAGLMSFLDPLTGGPDALGWPFGRSVYRTELLQLIQDVPGVDHVARLSMQADSGAPQCSDIPLCPTALVRSGEHHIEVS